MGKVLIAYVWPNAAWPKAINIDYGDLHRCYGKEGDPLVTRIPSGAKPVFVEDTPTSADAAAGDVQRFVVARDVGDYWTAKATDLSYTCGPLTRDMALRMAEAERQDAAALAQPAEQVKP